MRHQLWIYDLFYTRPVLRTLTPGVLTVHKSRLSAGYSRHSWRDIHQMRWPTGVHYELVQFESTSGGCHPHDDLDVLLFDEQATRALDLIGFTKQYPIRAFDSVVITDKLRSLEIVDRINKRKKFDGFRKAICAGWSSSPIQRYCHELDYKQCQRTPIYAAQKLLGVYESWESHHIFGDYGIWFIHEEIAPLISGFFGPEWRRHDI